MTSFRTVPYDREELLKRSALALAAIACLPAPCSAAASDLVVGSVRDDAGDPIVRAEVRSIDPRGTTLASGRTDAIGTFAIASPLGSARIEIRCAHCRTTSVPLGDATNFAIVVTRYRALERDVPGERDLATLPYGKVSDVFALVPFVLPGGPDNAFVSDRGLGAGRGLAVDDGAALPDLVLGTPTLTDVPDRFANELDLVRADRAYRYGSSAGGGIFSADSLGARTRAALDGGRPSTFEFAPVAGDVHAALGVSHDGTVLARRADVDVVAGFAGGTLRAGVTTATQDVPRRVRHGARIAYATASRRYRTSLEGTFDDVIVTEPIDYRSTYFTVAARLERPGPVALAAGVRASEQVVMYPIASRRDDRSLYLEADSSLGNARAHGALAFGSVYGGRYRPLPEFDVRYDLGAGSYARAGYSRSLRLPPQLDVERVSNAVDVSAFEEANLFESAIGIDTGRRLRAEAIAYREVARGIASHSLDGIGASLVWQIVPTISLRAWTLRATHAGATSLEIEGTTDATRGVIWATYANADAFRLDAIVRREVRGAARATASLDAGAFVPLAPNIALVIGTTARAIGRRYSLGVRVP